MIGRTLVAMGLVGVLALAAAGFEEQQQVPRNVLVIVLDDLGTDQLGFYNQTPGCTLPLTPNLDKLREQGILFTRAHANPVCSATRACIQTGRYGLRTGVGYLTSYSANPNAFELYNGEVLLAELVRKGRPLPLMQYKCGAFGKWHLSTSGDDTHPTDNGYHRFQGTMGNVVLSGDHFNWEKVDIQNPNSPLWISALLPEPPEYTREYWQSSVASNDALAWINAQTKPFLAYVCFNAPHEQLQVPPDECLSDETLAELGNLTAGTKVLLDDLNADLVYRAMVEGVDFEIGNLIDNINPLKLSNTMIFIIGDNGTVEDFLCPPAPGGGKGSMFETGIRIPLIVNGPLVPSGPSVPPEGWTSDALVDAVDVWRTIADITDSSVNAAMPLTPLDSKSFLSVIQDPDDAMGSRTYSFSQIYQPNGQWPPACGETNWQSISNGRYKLVRIQDNSLQAPPCPPVSWIEGLVDLETDPTETTNLYPPSPALQSTYDALVGELNAITGQ